MRNFKFILFFKIIAITFVNYGLQSIIIEDDGEGVSAVNMNEIGN